MFAQIEASHFNNLTHYSSEEGLSSTYVSDIQEDKDGFLWIATSDGISRFDGSKFSTYKFYTEKDSIYELGFINAILIDDFSGKIWIGGDNGIFFKSINDIHFHKIEQLTPSRHSLIPMVHDLLLDDQNKVWIASGREGLRSFDIKNNSLETFLFESNEHEDKTKLNKLHCLSMDAIDRNILWIGTGAGLIRFDILSKAYQVFVYDQNNQKAQNQIRKIHVGEKNVFLGTWAEGLVTFNKKNKEFSQPLKKDFPNSHELIYEIYKGNENKLWISTDYGLIDYNIHAAKVNNIISHNLKRGVVNGVSFIDSRGIVWFGYGKGLFKYDPLESQNIYIELEERSELENAMLVREIIDSDGYFYVLGYASSGLYKINPIDYSFEVIELSDLEYDEKTGYNLRDMVKMENGNFLIISGESVIIFDPSIQESSLSPLQVDHPHPSFQSIIKDKDNNYWIGGREGGLFCLSFKNNTIQNFRKEFDAFKDGNHRWINSLYLDSKEKLWIGKSSSIAIIDLADSSIVYVDQEDNKEVKSYQDISKFQEDIFGRIWIAGYKDGLGYSDFENYNNGITHKIDGYFTGVYPHNDSLLWTTGDGMGELNVNSMTHNSISLKSIDNKLKVRGPVISFKEEEYMVGCENGVIVYNPSKQAKSYGLPSPYIRSITGNGRILYSGNNLLTKALNFERGTNHLVIDVSSLGFYLPNETSYKYKIHDEWIELGPSQKINFTNLTQGNYSFSLKACNNLNVCNESAVVYNFTIEAYWYKSWWAYILYTALFSTIIALLYQFNLQRKLAVAEKQKAKEYNEYKSNMYANISHELRTPLTVILGMSDNLKNHVVSNSDAKPGKYLELIDRNGKKLLQLVNEMLDLSKLESSNMKLQMNQSDIIPFLKYLSESFQSFAAQKEMILVTYSEIEDLEMDFDSNKLGSVISNLLSNALKFTPEKGKIIVHLNKIQENGVDYCSIKVIDNGIGLSTEEVPYVFNKFYQVNTSQSKQGKGTGIGLSLTQELVGLMNGTIAVKSILGKGSTFSILLPITNIAPTTEEPSLSGSPPATITPLLNTKQKTFSSINSNLPVALIIEDNEDVAAYLTSCLEGRYETFHAHDGIQGIEMAYKKIPDIIISDVMMPGKDGFEVCKTLKSNELTDHIPIVLLTAKATAKDRLVGLTHGADAYLVKPFIKAELFTRLDRLVALRKTMLRKFEKLGVRQIMTNKGEDSETKFLQKAVLNIHKDISNHAFGAAHLAHKLHLSESQVYRKLKAITGKSTAVFIRYIRLEKGKQLIQSTDKNISEIAYEVGFNDPSWFSRAFKEEYGFTPNTMRN